MRFDGAKLQKLRTDSGMSRRQAAIALPGSVTVQTFGNWETGRATPHVNHLPQLADLFKVQERAFFSKEQGHEISESHERRPV